MKLMYKCRGSVSVFLVLVLLPMLTVASLFVDISRVKMGTAVVETASDLALNAALSQYDNMVKDIYGLFATSQDIDDIYDKLEEYYKKSIMEQGVSGDDAALYAQQIMGTFFKSEETGYDNLLKMSVQEFDVGPSSNASLVNPAVMKSEIVEFMKYRAPIKAGLSLIEGIKSMSNLQKQVEVVENKNNYYKEKANMLDDLENAWNYIREYEYRHVNSYPETAAVEGHGFPSERYYITEEISWLNDNKDDLEGVYDELFYYYRYGRTLGENLIGMRADGTNLTGSFENNYKILKSEDNWTAVTQGQPAALSSSYTNITVSGRDGNYHLKSSGSGISEVWKTSGVGDEAVIKSYVFNDVTMEYDLIDKSADYGITSSSTSNAGEVAKGLLDEYFLIEGKIEASETRKLLENWQATSSYSYRLYTLYMFNKDVLENGDNSYPQLIKKLTETLLKLNELYKYVSNESNPGHNAYINSMQAAYRESNIEEYTKSVKDKLTLSGSGRIAMYNEYVHRLSEDLNNDLLNQYNNEINKVNNTLSSVGNRIVALDSMIAKKKANLTNAKTYLEKAKTTSVDKCEPAMETWQTSNDALGEDDPMGASNTTEIGRENDSVSAEMISKLITRIDNAISTLDKIDAKINEYKIADNYWLQMSVTDANRIDIEALYVRLYNGVTAKGLTDAYNVVPKNGNEFDTIITNLKADNQYNVKASTTYTEADAEHALDLTKAERRLFTWMYNNYGGSEKLPATEGDIQESTVAQDTDAANSKDSTIDSYKSAATSAKDQTVEKTEIDTSKFDKDDTNLPSKQVTSIVDQGKDLSSDANDEDSMLGKVTGSDNKGGLNSLLSNVLEAIKDMSVTLRDEIYISTYIMNMFTFSTYDAELIDKYNKKTGSTATVGALYKNESGTEYITNTADPEYGTIVQDAKTLTNTKIDPNNNYLYGSEIEYMVYGDPSKDAFGTIYVIRFAFNTVYAFMDPEIGSYTTSAATALFGVPPLTPLIPIAKVAFTVAWALAESGVDVYRLKQGEAVPLMKNKDTWVLLPSNLSKAVGTEILDKTKDVAKQKVNDVISKGAQQLNEWAEMTDKELDTLINNYNDAAIKSVTEIGKYINSLGESFTNQVNAYANQAVMEYADVCNHVKQRLSTLTGLSLTPEEIAELDIEDSDLLLAIADGSIGDDDIVALIKSEMNAWLVQQKGSGGDDVIYQAQLEAVNIIISVNVATIIDEYETITAEKFTDKVEENTAAIQNILQKKIKAVQKKIDNLISDSTSELSKKKKEIIENFTSKIDGGAEKLREYASNGIDSMFSNLEGAFGDVSENKVLGGTSSNMAENLKANLLSWRYSDYLQVLLLVNLFVNEQKVLTRMADVMQTNIRNMKDGKADFLFSKSYTYLTLTTEVEVKPLLSVGLLSNAGFKDISSDWYTIKYTNTLGY